MRKFVDVAYDFELPNDSNLYLSRTNSAQTLDKFLSKMLTCSRSLIIETTKSDANS